MDHSALPAAHPCAVDTTFVSLGAGKVAFLGVVQGITELLPVSSTAHMRAVPAFLGWPDPGSAFSAAMQLAALAAVIGYFYRDLAHVAGGFFRAFTTRSFGTPEFRFGAGIIIATIPIVIVGGLLSGILNQCNSPLRTPLVIGIACFGMAVIMGIAELTAKHRRTAESLTYWDALIIGIAQVGALIPGVSRSGSSLTGALFLGFKREEAAGISFMLGVPAIAAAGLKELWTLHKAGLSAEGWHVLGIGLIVSSLSAFVAIWGLMRFLERFSTWPLVIYRAAFGLVVIAGAYYGWIH